MSDNSIPQVREPDKLDLTLLAGYTYHVYTGGNGTLVAVRILRPNGIPFNEVYGIMDTEGALVTLEKAVGVASAHMSMGAKGDG